MNINSVQMSSSHPHASQPCGTWEKRSWEIAQEVASASLPFLMLYKPLSKPLALGTGVLRVAVSSLQLAETIHRGDPKEVFSQMVRTAVAVVSLAGTLFAHPLGMLIATGYDLILEMRQLASLIQQNKRLEALESAMKIAGHAAYFAFFLYGLPELAICFLVLQVATGLFESRKEFAEGHFISAIGHALMAALRGSQIRGQVQMMQMRAEIQKLVRELSSSNPSEEAISKSIGKLAEKWQFPSDHLPIGAKVGDANVISFNILNGTFIDWITEKDSQGLNGSMISQLDRMKSTRYPGLTMRDEFIMTLLLKIINNPAHHDRLILSLQECSPAFIQTFSKMLPPDIGFVSTYDNLKALDQNVVIYNKERFDLQEKSIVAAYPRCKSPSRLMDLLFVDRITSTRYQVINTHLPGDPNLPGKEEFAEYVLTHQKPNATIIAMGDMNFKEHEMYAAFDQVAASKGIQSPFRALPGYYTNIEPYTYEGKRIDHFFVKTDLPCESMEANEVVEGLQDTVDLLYPTTEKTTRVVLRQAVEAQKLEELRKWYHRRQELEQQLLYPA